MAIQGAIAIEFATAFPRGSCAAGGFEPVRDFGASKGGRFVQSKDKTTGLPCGQSRSSTPTPRARDKTAKVKVAAAEMPVLPAGSAASPYVSQAGRLAYSLKATGVRAPGRNGRGPEARDNAA